jgi:hypothetical protein
MRRGCVALILLLFLVPLATAVEFEMKEEFQGGELLLAKVSGNFIDQITEENVAFYRDGHVRVGIISQVDKINDEFYISASLPETSKNYSLKIEDVRYMKGSQTVEEDIIRNFTITNQSVAFSATPGAFVTEEDFSITVQNLLDKKITLTATLLEGTQSHELKSGDIKTLDFEADLISNDILEFLTLSSEGTIYSIPVFIPLNASEEEEDDKFDFIPHYYNLSMSTGVEKTFVAYLNNSGEADIENILLEVSNSLEDHITLSVGEVDNLGEGSNIKIEFYIEEQENEGSLEGFIKASTEDKTRYLTLNLNFIPDFIPSEAYPEVITETGTTIPDAPPALIDDSEDGEGGFSWGTVMGWGLLIIVVLGVGWFLMKKYRKTKAAKPDLIKVGEKGKDKKK